MRMLLVRRARIEGFISFDYRDRYADATAQLARWVEEGKIAYAEDVVDGLEQVGEKLVKIGAMVVSHGRCVTFQMAEVAMTLGCLRRCSGIDWSHDRHHGIDP